MLPSLPDSFVLPKTNAITKTAHRLMIHHTPSCRIDLRLYYNYAYASPHRTASASLCSLSKTIQPLNLLRARSNLLLFPATTPLSGPPSTYVKPASSSSNAFLILNNTPVFQLSNFVTWSY